MVSIMVTIPTKVMVVLTLFRFSWNVLQRPPTLNDGLGNDYDTNKGDGGLNTLSFLGMFFSDASSF